MIGARNTVPSKIARMVPFGLFHISFRSYSVIRAAFGVIVAHFTATPYFFVALENFKNRIEEEYFFRVYCRDDITRTFEAIGPHWQSNPYNLPDDTLLPHGEEIIPWGELSDEDGEVSFNSIREYLSSHVIEGIVFWKDGKPNCKIKRSDFGFKWPEKESK